MFWCPALSQFNTDDGKTLITHIFRIGAQPYSKHCVKNLKQAIKKGKAYINIFIYVIRLFEDTLDNCKLDSITKNYN